MSRRRADATVAAFLGAVLLGGGVLSWQAAQQRRTVDQGMGSMMDGSMQSMYGPDPLWYVFGTALVAVVVGGVYLVVREEGGAASGGASSARADADVPKEKSGDRAENEAGEGKEVSREVDQDDPATRPRNRVLDLLPEDERRILEPVIDSPGITQIELRDRSEFSKSKVSQTVSELEQRGLLSRERQGRTYRVYPSDDLDARERVS